MPKHPFPDLVLWGLSGCGKSTLGKLLATQCDKKFFDTDLIIEEKTGRTVSEIIYQFGIDAFRLKEKLVVEELLQKRRCIISTGGGTITNEHLLSELLQSFICVWIKRDPEKILKSISDNIHKRPLLSENPSAIYTLFENRKHLYASAHFYVDNNGSIDETIHQIMMKAAAYASK